MEPLINLAVRINQVAVVHGENVIDTNVDIDPREAILVLEQGHLDGWNVAQSSFFGDLLDDLPAVFDQLVLIVSHPTMEHNDDIYVATARRPETVHARAGCRDRYLALEQVALCAAVSIIECIFDPFDDLVARL